MAGDCVTLWIGDALGPVERACLLSVLRQGHPLAIYCYRPPEGLPKGVELRDANAIIPEQEVFVQRKGSVAAFSDWFRYELQKRAAGTWIDTDVYLLRPLDAEAPYLFGEEEPGVVNNAVLRLPPDSLLLCRLLQVFEDRTTPKWLHWRPYLRARAGELIRRGVDLTSLPWGTTGPMALTKLTKELGLASHVQPCEVFSPVPWSRAEWIRDPDISLEDVTTARTVAVHLWNYCIASFKNAPARKGSFLDRLHREGRISARAYSRVSPLPSRASSLRA